MHAHYGKFTCQCIHVLLAILCRLLMLVYLPANDLQYSVCQLSLPMHALFALFTALLSGMPGNVKDKTYASHGSLRALGYCYAWPLSRSSARPTMEGCYVCDSPWHLPHTVKRLQGPEQSPQPLP